MQLWNWLERDLGYPVLEDAFDHIHLADSDTPEPFEVKWGCCQCEIEKAVVGCMACFKRCKWRVSPRNRDTPFRHAKLEMLSQVDNGLQFVAR